MATRTTTTTDGKRTSFSYDGEYYLPDSKNLQEVFNGFDKCSACVAYTTINGEYEEEMHYGYPSVDRKYKGLVGYQNFNFFKTIEEAKEDYANRKRLSTKVGIDGYADVFMVINKNRNN